MLSHGEVWALIDRLARRHGMSPSGLARRAGLDPTTFNRSKRVGVDGRPRWPSTESLSKVLDVVGISLLQVALEMHGLPVHPVEDGGAMPLALSMVPGFAEDENPYLPPQNGAPLEFPAADTLSCRAWRVRDDRLAPHYHVGDVLILSAGAPLAIGARVLLVLKGDGPGGDGAKVARLTGLTADAITATVIGGADDGIDDDIGRTFARADIRWSARILWLSQ